MNPDLHLWGQNPNWAGIFAQDETVRAEFQLTTEEKEN
jgi:hypothetical protein